MANPKIILTAEDQASAAIRKVGASFDSIESGVDKLSLPLLKVQGLIAAFTGGALIGGIRATIGALDDLADTAPGIGLAASELSAFQLTAKSAGVSSQELTAGLSKFATVLDSARGGNKDAIETLRALGITQKELVDGSLSTADAFRRSADALAGYADGYEKTALARDAFGKTGQKFVALMNEGAEGLSKFGGASQQAIDDAARLQSQVDKLSASWEKLWLQVAGGVARALLPAELKNNTAAQIKAVEAQIAAVEQDISSGRTTKGVTIFDQLFGDQDRIGTARRQLEALRAQLEGLRSINDDVQGSPTTRRVERESPEERAAREKAEAAAAAARKKRDEDALQAQLRAWEAEKQILAEADAAGVKFTREEDARREKERLQLLETEAVRAEAGRRARDALVLSLATDRDLEQLRFKEQLDNLQTALLTQEFTEAEYRQKREEAEQQHQARLGDVAAQGAIARRDFARLTAMQQTQTVLGELQNLTQGVATKSRAMFEVNKVSGIANAIVNTYESVTKTMAKYPYPINLALAGVTLAAGMAQVNAIRSAKFGTSTSAPSISGGGAVPVTSADVPSPTPVTPPSAAPARSDIRIRVEGLSGDRLLTSQQVRDLIRQIGEEAGFGANVSFVAA